METNFTVLELQKLKAVIQDSRTNGQTQGIISKQISECAQKVITSAAMIFVSIVLSEMNEKGKFGWLAGFRIVSKIIKSINEIMIAFRACKEGQTLNQ